MLCVVTVNNEDINSNGKEVIIYSSCKCAILGEECTFCS